MPTSLRTILLLLLIALLNACKSEPAYKTVAVDFFIQHPEFSITPPTFDTLTEQVLVRQAHLAGATFDTAVEQVLLREKYRDLKIMDIEFINILTDHEENLYCAAPCINYYSEELVEELEVQAKYIRRNVEIVAINGTGNQIPPTSETRYYYRQKTDASIHPEPAETAPPLRKIFRIPVDMDFETFWQQSLSEQNLPNCGDDFTYNVVEL